jgi:hypothetical protein
VNIHVLDKNYFAATERTPALLNPFPGNEAIYEKMKMGYTALVKFENGNVFDRSTVSATQIQPELVEHTAQITN